MGCYCSEESFCPLTQTTIIAEGRVGQTRAATCSFVTYLSVAFRVYFSLGFNFGELFTKTIVTATERVGQTRAATCSVVTLLLVDSYLYGDLFTTLTKL